MGSTKTENEDLIRRFRTEVYQEGNLDALDEYVAEDCVSHSPLVPEPKQGIEAYREFAETLLSAFPDYSDSIEDVLAAGNKVFVRVESRGTHEGEFMDLEPTGTEVEVSGMVLYRIEDGAIVEDWHQADLMGLMEQLEVE